MVPIQNKGTVPGTGNKATDGKAFFSLILCLSFIVACCSCMDYVKKTSL